MNGRTELTYPARDTVIRTGYDLVSTLASGQTFAFERDCGRGYAGIAGGRPVRILAAGDAIDGVTGNAVDGGSAAGGAARADGGAPAYEIHCAAADEGFWRRYFDLDRVYAGELADFIDSDTDGCAGSDADGAAAAVIPAAATHSKYAAGRRYLTASVKAFGGLRLLKQPVWETVCEFILSANNHQKRIESLYRRISERYGDAVRWDGRTFYAFPPPGRLAAASEAELRSLGAGYRSPYIRETAGMVAANGLPDLDAMDYGGALNCLMRLKGVGEKVADCVLLFSTRHRGAFPVDVWMERVLCDIYGMSGTRKALKREAQAYFGDSAGLAQQFLFHAIRTELKV